jgi:catechol 2,3-dioxygenase-like lactoylglutathione lyase family enzyme
MSLAARRSPNLQNPTNRSEMPETATHIKDIGRVAVPVADQDRAIEFYVGKLGFEKRSDMPYGDGDRWIEVAPAGATTALALVPPRQGDSAGVNTNVILTTDDADAARTDLAARGVDVDEAVMRMGDPVPPMFFFRDQDGNTLLVVEGA